MLAEGRIDRVLYPKGDSCAQLDVSPCFMVGMTTILGAAAQLFKNSEPEKTWKADLIHRFRRLAQIFGSDVWALAPVRPFRVR